MVIWFWPSSTGTWITVFLPSPLIERDAKSPTLRLLERIEKSETSAPASSAPMISTATKPSRHALLVFGEPHVEFRRLALEQPLQLVVDARPHLAHRLPGALQDDRPAHHLRAPEIFLELAGADEAAFLVAPLVDMPADQLVAFVGGVVVALRHPDHEFLAGKEHADDQLARLQVPQPERLVGAAGDHQAGLLGRPRSH